MNRLISLVVLCVLACPLPRAVAQPPQPGAGANPAPAGNPQQEKTAEDKLGDFQLFLIRWYPLITVTIGVVTILLLIIIGFQLSGIHSELKKRP
jgi:hypothetical protein